MEEFFGRVCLGGIFFGEFFLTDFFGRIFQRIFFGRNSLFILLKSANLFDSKRD